jgi:uncharacterized protein YkuJ
MKRYFQLLELVNSLTRYKKHQKNFRRYFELEAKIVGEVKYDRHRDQTLRLHRRRMGVRTPFLLLNPNTGKTIVQGSESFGL